MTAARPTAEPTTILRTRRPSCKEVLTAPNAISVAGYLLVLSGTTRMTTARGVASIVAGRASDLIDGTVARATGTTSDFGAGLDASLDKLGMATILTGAWLHRSMPRPAILAMILHNALNATATVIHARRWPEDPLRQTRVGKVVMFAEEVGVLS